MADLLHWTGPSPVYITVSQQGAKQIEASALAFKYSYTDSEYFRITFRYSYPAEDTAAKEMIEGILASLR